MLLLAFVVVWLAYRGRTELPPRVRTLCAGLKTLGFALLALCLLQPEYIRTAKEEQKTEGVHQVALVYDNSLGLTVTDQKQSKTRGKILSEALEDAAFREELGETFDLREYLVDQGLRRGKPSQLTFDGQASDLAHGLQSLARRARGGTLNAIVLFTDGNATDRDRIDLDLATLPPIYSVVLGSEKPRPDLSLDRVQTTQSGFEEAPIRFQADVVARGKKGTSVDAVLYDKEGTEIGRERVAVAEDEERIAVRFNHRPLEPGPAFYRMALESADGAVDELAGNDERHVAVHRESGPYRILYVAGRPNWEFKFLHRAVAPDREIDLVGLIRIAKREPKFSFRGRSGEASNPLFRGFNNADEEDGFDQPILQRIYTRDEEELRGGFPDSEEDLFGYHAIILDDLEAGFFSQDQMDLVDAFVSKRGGGLLMLGGQECFVHGGYEKTPFADMLPVYVNKLDGDIPAPDSRSLRLDLTREGWLQPWVRLRETEDSERQRLATMSPFSTLNRVAAIKPGASVLANVSVDGTKKPGLVAHRYGHGRAGALLVGDLWRWGFRQPEQRPDMEKAWRQTLRWLVADVPDRVSVTPKRDASTVNLETRVRDENFEAATSATVALRVLQPGGELLELEGLPSEDEAGRFVVGTKPDAAGTYRADVIVTDEEGEEIGVSATGWALNPAAEELRSIVPDRGWLEELAEATGGEVLTLDDVGELTTLIKHPTVTVEVTKVVSIWHLPFVFLAALLCFLAEWWLRRERGMA